MNRAPNWDQQDEGLGNFDDYGEDLSQGRRGYKGRGKGRDRDGPYEKRTKLGFVRFFSAFKQPAFLLSWRKKNKTRDRG